MNPSPEETTLNLRDLLLFFVRGALIAGLLAVLAGVGAYVYTARQQPVYRAEATLLVARGAGGAQFGVVAVTAPPIDLGAYRVAGTSDSVLRDALVLLGEEAPTAEAVRRLRTRVAVSPDPGARDSSLLRVDGRGASAAEAVGRANATAAALVAWDRRRASDSIDRVINTLTLQVEALSEQIRALQTAGDAASQGQVDGLIRLRAEQQQQLAYARALVASAEGMLSVLQAADASARQIAPRPFASGLAAALIAVIVTYGLLFLRVALNTRIRGSDDVIGFTGLPVLAEFPAVGRTEEARLREASSYLRTNLLFATDDIHPRVFMVTSSVDNEGKTVVSRQLAEGFVRYGYKTLLIDADLRRPSVIQAYEVVGDLPTDATTEAWLQANGGAQRVLSGQVDAHDSLDIIPQFTPVANPAELLGRGIRDMLEACRGYDIVVIDSPPILAVADPLTIAPHCSGTVFVIDRSRTDRRKVSNAVGALERVGVRVLGVVMNRQSPSDGRSGLGTPYGGVYGEDAPPRTPSRGPAASAAARRGRSAD